MTINSIKLFAMRPLSQRRALLLGLLSTGLMLTCSPEHPSYRPPVAVRLETVTPAPPASGTRYSGTVRARTQLDLSFRVGGYVEAIATAGREERARGEKGNQHVLQAGDRVTPGMVLASLRQSDYQQRVSEASAMGDQALAASRKAKSDYQRAKQLFAQGAISRAEYEASKSLADSLVGSRKAAAARVGQMKLTLRDTELRSPLAGIVLERNIEVGALVAPGAPAFVLADISSVRVIFGVPDSQQGGIAVGQQATVTTAAAPDRVFSGVISKIAAQADSRTRMFDVEATIPNPERFFKVGMVTTIQVGRGAASSVPQVVVPLSAVVRRPTDGDSFTVYLAGEEHGAIVVRARQVELGNLVGNRVAVSRGLGIGERMVVQGSSLLADGAFVNVVPLPAPAGAGPERLATVAAETAR